MSEVKKVYEQLIKLTEWYTRVKRGNIHGVLLEEWRDLHPDEGIDFENPMVRDSDMMHVGHLPAIATHIHPYIEHRDQVDLGHVLKLLSIHEIGEIHVGDVMTVARSKTSRERDAEKQAAHAMLHPDHRAWYDEFEAKGTFAAKYANSIDKLSWQLVACTCPAQIDEERLVKNGTSVERIYELYRPVMEWDSFLAELLDYVFEHGRKHSS